MGLVGCGDVQKIDPARTVAADSATDNRGLIGGSAPNAPEFPSALLIEGSCSAALVGPQRILLAGHCVFYPPEGVHPPRNGAILSLKRGRRKQLVHVAGTFIHPVWHAAPSDISAGVGVDVAVIATREVVHIVPSAHVLISRRINDWENVYLTGFGCQVSNARPYPQPEQFKWGFSVAIPSLYILPPFPSYFSGPADPRYGAVANDYLITPGIALNSGLTSLCRGDSGGPLYLNDGTQATIVGVNSYYTFGADQAHSYTNWHTRTDAYNRGNVGLWLAQLGVSVQ